MSADYDGAVSKSSRNSAIRSGASADSDAAGEGPDALERALAELWESVAAGDVLTAEMRTAAFTALPHLTNSSPEDVEKLAAALVNAGSEHHSGEESAAFFRLLISLGSRPIKREASRALAELTEDGVYPPSWVTGIGKAVPGQAWRLHDVFGDRESIVISFSYGETEHALLVAVDLVETPTAGMIGVTEDAEGILTTLRDNAQPFERLDPITLAEARRRLEVPLARAGENPDLPLDRSSVLFLPLVRSRFRRLPAGDPGQVTVYTAADRAAAVEEFLRSPDGASAGDPDSARFWATVLTGYSSRATDEPPAQVGPNKLAAMLLVHVPSTFTLTAAQRDGVRPAVTAWTRWATGRQGLDEAATDFLMMRLPEILDEFPAAYDDPSSVLLRGYLGDLATADADLGWLADQRARREFAMPLPANLDADLAAIDVTAPGQRTARAVSEFAECGAEGEARDQLLTAVTRLVEEAWTNDPPATWEKARRMLTEGHSRHDVIHRLAR